jgi:hypothetical protein
MERSCAAARGIDTNTEKAPIYIRTAWQISILGFWLKRASGWLTFGSYNYNTVLPVQYSNSKVQYIKLLVKRRVRY